jgi:DNA repair ATPase RecN
MLNQFKVLWSEEDGEWVRLCSDHPYLSHLAKTEEEALAGIGELVESVEGLAVRSAQKTEQLSTIQESLSRQDEKLKDISRSLNDVSRSLNDVLSALQEMTETLGGGGKTPAS